MADHTPTPPAPGTDALADRLDLIDAKLDALLAFASRVEQVTAQLGQLDPGTMLRGLLGR